jgi:hypothetical protein
VVERGNECSLLDDSTDRLFNGNGVLFDIAAKSDVVPFFVSNRPFVHCYLLYLQFPVDKDANKSLLHSSGF